MNDKQSLRRKVWELDFVLHELVLYLDSHPECERALSLMREYRKLRRETLEEYERRFGKMPTTVRNVKPEGVWTWIDGPWPWENNFAEGK